VYREWAAPEGLTCAWTRAASSETVRVVPDGCTDLIFFEATGELYVAGPDTAAQATAVPDGRAFGVRFPPGVGPAVFGAPGHALRNLRVPATELWGDARRLADGLSSADDPARTLTSIAVTRLRAASPDPLAALARTAFDVPSLARSIGVTDRQLRRRCLDAFGYGPKVLQRVLRFDRAVALARTGLPFADVAVRCGYADQAHLSREVKALSGVPLGVLLS
jgi:AraC-like DNA-binding protein